MSDLSLLERGRLERARSEALLGRIDALLKARGFDPSEPRDEEGKWTDEGGDGKAKKEVEKLEDISKEIDLDLGSSSGEKFVEAWNEHVSEAPAEFKREFMGGLPGSMKIEARGDGETWVISGRLDGKRKGSVGTFARTIDWSRREAIASFFKLSDKETGKDIGKKMLAANVAMYQKLGLKGVETHANIDVGGYAWARYGYVPTEDSWRELRDEIRDAQVILSAGDAGDTLLSLMDSDDPKAVWAIADSPWGKDLLLGSEWDGYLDFGDRETMARFNAYVGKSKH